MIPFPLSALVGQEKMRLALILNAIDPLIGGVLICGRRGTGKSTAARSLPTLLPPITGVADCPYFCDPATPQWMCSGCQARYERRAMLPIVQRPVPLVTLPLNASEDRVAGSFNLATALESGKRYFAPGLLATANRGLLYVDEINLLNDHIADLLLDAAALGVNRVERDGISVVHPSRFVLIGTMNPDEGTLRPQLLDRIGLYVEAEDIRNPAMRAVVVERRLAYDAAPAGFAARWVESEQVLRERIQQAQHLLPSVRISQYFRQVVAHLVARELHAAGHRGDLVVIRTARALAAWEQRSEVERADIEQAVALAMTHRARPGRSISQQLARTFDHVPAGGIDLEQPEELATIDEDVPERRDEREGPAGLTRPLRGEHDVVQVQNLIQIQRDRLTRQESGRRFVSPTARRNGRFTRSRRTSPVTDIAFADTIRAAAPEQRARGRSGEGSVCRSGTGEWSGEGSVCRSGTQWSRHNERSGGHSERSGGEGRLELRADDLRQKIRERKTRSLLIFVVDGSDSVMARQLMPQIKRVLLALLQNAYEKRDRVAMLTFRFAQGRIVLPPTRNFSRARRCVEELYVGGCTPLATGLLEGLRLAETERLRDPTVKPVLIVLTDGLANIDLSGNMRHDTPQRDALKVAQEIASCRIPTVMIDTNPNLPSTAQHWESKDETTVSLSRELAMTLAADYYQLCHPGATTLLKRG